MRPALTTAFCFKFKCVKSPIPTPGSKNCSIFDSPPCEFSFTRTESRSLEPTSKVFNLATPADIGILTVPAAAAPFSELTARKKMQSRGGKNKIYSNLRIYIIRKYCCFNSFPFTNLHPHIWLVNSPKYITVLEIESQRRFMSAIEDPQPLHSHKQCLRRVYI